VPLLFCVLTTHYETFPTAGRIRKRDQIKSVVKNAFGLKKEEHTSGEVSAQPDGVQVQQTEPKRRMMKLVDGKKYEKIECLEEKAYQILKDLNMIEEHN
jgi:hypothetical protein